MHTDEIIKMLRDIIAGHRTTDGIPTAELMVATDRLKELQRQVEIEKQRANGHYENYLEMLKRIDVIAKERDEARAEVERLSVQVADWELLSDRLKEAMEIAKQKTKARNDAFDDLRKERDEYAKQRDEARAEVERLKIERRNAERKLVHWKKIAEHRQKELSGLLARPEPSRLEIAAMLMAGCYANPEADVCATDEKWWVERADALITAAREGK